MDEAVRIGRRFEAALRDAVGDATLWVPGIGNGALGGVLQALAHLTDEQIVGLIRKAVARWPEDDHENHEPSPGERVVSVEPELVTLRGEDLAQKLVAYGIDVSRFGTGTAKTLDHLRAELESGEAQLLERDGRLIRGLLGVLNVDVWFDGADGRYRLIEDRQEFANGEIRRRELSASVSEKLKPGETLPEAVHRALAEELGVHGFAILSPFRETATVAESPSFPGLLTEYPVHQVEVLLDRTEFLPEYREVQADKSTFFRWEKL